MSTQFKIFKHGDEFRIYTKSMLMEINSDITVAKIKLLYFDKTTKDYNTIIVLTGTVGQFYIMNNSGESIGNDPRDLSGIIDAIDSMLINTLVVGGTKGMKALIEQMIEGEDSVKFIEAIDGTKVIMTHGIMINSDGVKEILPGSIFPPGMYSLILGIKTFDEYFESSKK